MGITRLNDETGNELGVTDTTSREDYPDVNDTVTGSDNQANEQTDVEPVAFLKLFPW